MIDIARLSSVTLLAFLSATYYNPTPAMAAPSRAEKQRVVCALRSNPELLTVLRKSPDYQGLTCDPAQTKPAVAKSVPMKQMVATDPTSAPSGTNSKDSAPSSPISYLLRNDWSDVGLLGTCFAAKGSGVDTSKAKGASVSFTRDYAGNNKIWAAQAMGAAVYTECNLSIPPPRPDVPGFRGVFEKTVAIYAQINSDYNSDAKLAKKNNQDTRTLGLSGELGYLYGMDYNVIRLTPNVVFDNIKNTTAAAVKLQYVPIWVNYSYLWHWEPLFGGLLFRFDPTLDFEYANAIGHSAPLQFSGKDQSFRIGPELTFRLAPDADPNNFFGHIGFLETFHPWYDTYRAGGSYWWSNSVFYNIDQKDNIAVSFSYNRGLDENSGVMTNQYILSLTGKI